MQIVLQQDKKDFTLKTQQNRGFGPRKDIMKSSPVMVTKFVNGVAQTPTIHAVSKSGYVLCVNDAGVSGYPDRVVRRSTSLSAIVAGWFDLGGEGGNAWVYHANGDALSSSELAAAREQLGEMA